jgi:hypothetical protein
VTRRVKCFDEVVFLVVVRTQKRRPCGWALVVNSSVAQSMRRWHPSLQRRYAVFENARAFRQFILGLRPMRALSACRGKTVHFDAACDEKLQSACCSGLRRLGSSVCTCGRRLFPPSCPLAHHEMDPRCSWPIRRTSCFFSLSIRVSMATCHALSAGAPFRRRQVPRPSRPCPQRRPMTRPPL